MQRLHDQYVFFLDENLCNCAPIQQILTAAEIKYERLLAHFASGTPDIIWLSLVGQLGWIAITKDSSQRYNELEKEAIIANNVRQFAFNSGNRNREEMADLLRDNLNRIFRLIEKQPPPFVASIVKSGVNLKSL